MHLYNLTIQPPTAIVQAIVGSFSGRQKDEIVVSHGTQLDLLRVNTTFGKLDTVVSVHVFGSIRSIASFRLAGYLKDYILLTSDSGSLTILECDGETMSFKTIQQETFGKSGARRVVPGQHLAVDPHGRSVMVAAVEESKLVYTLSHDASANLTISSPLEANAKSTILHSVVGLDVGFDNPAFAALEFEYSDTDQDSSGQAFEKTGKLLTLYELDLGLNCIMRKWSESTDKRANLLLHVPGGSPSNGLSSVLICCENYIIYRCGDSAQQHRVPIPRRCHPLLDPKRGLIITAGVVHKMKDSFFFLLQSEDGDLFKVTLDRDRDEVKALKIKYFDTSGFLFVASEFGNHGLYRFLALGDDEGNDPGISSAPPPLLCNDDPHSPLSPSYFFQPHPLLNLVFVDELESLCPIIDSQIISSSSLATPQFVLACGRGSRRSLRILQHGLQTEDIASSTISEVPAAFWALKFNDNDSVDSHLIMSFRDAGTRVLSIGESFEEISDSGFLASRPTLTVQQIGQYGFIQVHSGGIRHILLDKTITEWTIPEADSIVSAASNQRQVVVALSTAQLVYFELSLGGQLDEYQERAVMGSTVLAMGMAEVSDGKLRAPYLAVGCQDQTVRIISLDPKNAFETVCLQALTSPPSSICVSEMSDATNNSRPTMLVNIGLQNGVLLQTILGQHTGLLDDSRSRFLGTRPVQLACVMIHGQSAILALSSRPWLIFVDRGVLQIHPLIYDVEMDSVCSFSSEFCHEGVIALGGNQLRIFKISHLQKHWNQSSMSLSYTPRQITHHPDNGLLYIIEGDNRTYPREMNTNGHFEQHGHLPAPDGTWASCIRVVDPTKLETLNIFPLDNNESAFSISIVLFSGRDDERFLIVGTAADTHVSPRSIKSGYLRTYKFCDNGRTIELVHKTEIDDIPLALLPFHGRLLAGVGRALRVYDLGQKQLLRKAENTSMTSTIVTLASQGSRIVVGDIQNSIFFVTWVDEAKRLTVSADDTQPRWTTAAIMVDYMTVAAGDRFGNILVNRLDSQVSDRLDNDPTAAALIRDNTSIIGAPFKTKMVAHFHVGDMVTSIHKVVMVSGGREVLLYTCLHGTIGLLVPLSSKEDIDFLSTLEQHVKKQQRGLTGRDQSSWRGYYAPVKAVIDGDLCETFAQLSLQQQNVIAKDLDDRSVGEILKKLEQLRILSSGV